MMKRLAAFAASLALVLLPICMPLASVRAQGGFDGGLGATVDEINRDQQKPIFEKGDTAEELIGRVIKNVLQVTGVLFFLLMLYAGVLWMTAQGDEKRVKEAKDTIKAAVIGIVVIGSAYAITNFVLSNVSTPES